MKHYFKVHLLLFYVVLVKVTRYQRELSQIRQIEKVELLRPCAVSTCPVLEVNTENLFCICRRSSKTSCGTAKKKEVLTFAITYVLLLIIFLKD